MQYMSVSHEYSTMGGIGYNDGVMWRRQKRRKSHINEANQRGYGDAHRLMLMQGVGIAIQQMH